jgi:hypothetical protein
MREYTKLSMKKEEIFKLENFDYALDVSDIELK